MKTKVISDLLAKYSRKLKPLNCLVELTNRCNLTCSHCYILKNKIKFLDYKVLTESLLKLKQLGCFKIAITGGEARLHPDFWKIIKFLEKEKFIFSIFTNATTYTRKDILSLKKLKNLTMIHISLYGSTPEVNDSITGIKGSFKKTISFIKQLKKLEIMHIVKIAIMKKNYKDMDNMSDLLDEMDERFVFAFSILPMENSDKVTTRTNMLSYNQLKSIHKLVHKIKTSFKTHTENEYKEFLESSICVAGKNKLVISYNGNVYPCVTLRMKCGNIYEHDITDIWYNSPEMNAVRNLLNKDVKKCVSCAYLSYCKTRCPGVSYFLYRDITKPSEIACKIAEINKEVETSLMD